MRLDFLDAFRFPFLSKSFGFFTLALGAVALAAVEAVVKMAFWAMRFLRVYIANRGRVALCVLGNRNSVQVLRVDARSIAARMVYDEAIGNRAVGKEHRDPMCFPVCTTKPDDSVAVLVFVILPNAAVANLYPFGVEALNFLFGGVAHSGSSPVSMSNTVSIVGV